ncbi:hypothetical protein TNCT_613091 [Trichonephila clavata]|uniref:Uncharacterized protein n=1 Tax=Trichonephila clavata TaxID=2740835 RepID=A0A8X6F5V6_TRICU|nr:hypothetical protein TNCT_613091 [Trichonephila clavata]
MRARVGRLPFRRDGWEPDIVWGDPRDGHFAACGGGCPDGSPPSIIEMQIVGTSDLKQTDKCPIEGDFTSELAAKGTLGQLENG